MRSNGPNRALFLFLFLYTILGGETYLVFLFLFFLLLNHPRGNGRHDIRHKNTQTVLQSPIACLRCDHRPFNMLFVLKYTHILGVYLHFFPFHYTQRSQVRFPVFRFSRDKAQTVERPMNATPPLPKNVSVPNAMYIQYPDDIKTSSTNKCLDRS
jgi:hypothetical protein